MPVWDLHGEIGGDDRRTGEEADHHRAPCTAVLQVGFQQRRHRAETLPTTAARLVQPLQPYERSLAPLLARPLLHGGHDVGRTSEASHIEHRGGGVEVVACQREHRLAGVRCGAEFEACIPERVPQCFGDATHGVVAHLRRVKQHHVDVTARCEHAARVAAGGHHRPAIGQP